MMNKATRIKIAALTTALALGGLTAAGLAARGGDAPVTAAKVSAETPQKPVVVHRRKVKTVVAKPKTEEPSGSALAAGVSSQAGPATVSVPESLGVLQSEDDDDPGEDEHEYEDEDEYEGEDD